MSDVNRSPKLWRRWIVVLGVLLAIPWIAKRLLEKGIEERARRIQLGQTQSEVVAILGQPEWSFSTPPAPAIRGFLYGPFPAWWHDHVESLIQSTIFRGKPCPFPIGISADSFPVRIDFDAAGRVNRVRIWSEEISARVPT